eukprot:g28685.t1
MERHPDIEEGQICRRLKQSRKFAWQCRCMLTLEMKNVSGRGFCAATALSDLHPLKCSRQCQALESPLSSGD